MVHERPGPDQFVLAGLSISFAEPCEGRAGLTAQPNQRQAHEVLRAPGLSLQHRSG